jgi:hypothetical protein
MSPSRVASWRRSIACCGPGGLVYAETPFMQRVHEGAFDFVRFTDVGHRRLFRMFDEIDRGVAVRPATALLWAARYLARSVLRRTGPAILWLDKSGTLAVFWLKYLDRILVGHPGRSMVPPASSSWAAGATMRSMISRSSGAIGETIGSVLLARGLRR